MVFFTLTVTAAVPAAAQPLAEAKGCFLQGLGPDGLGGLPPILKSIGDPAVHAKPGAILFDLGGRFKVLPRLYFADDAASPNAFAIGVTLGDPDDFPPDRNPFGSVVLGVNLFIAEVRATPAGEQSHTLAAILCSDLGHTLQGVNKCQLKKTPEKELHADSWCWAIKFIKRTVAPDLKESNAFEP